MSWLLGIPARVWEVLLAAGLALALLGAAVHHERQVGARKAQATLAAERTRAMSAATAAAAANQAEGDRREAAQQENRNEFDRLTARAVADNDRLDDSVRRLRERTAGGGAVTSDPAASRPGETQGGMPPAACVPADVFNRVVDAARRTAEYADCLRSSGDLCAADYDALTVR